MVATDIILKKCDELYDMIDSLSDDNLDENSINSLGELDGVISDIRKFGVSNDQVKALIHVLEKFEVSDYKDYHRNTLELLTVFLSYMVDYFASDEWNTDIKSISRYGIFDSPDTNEIGNIFYYSLDDINNEMLLVNCADKEQLGLFLREKNNIEDIVLIMVYLMNYKNEYRSVLVAKKKGIKKEQKSITDYIKMYAVLNGDVFHHTRPVTAYPVSLSVKYEPNIEYSQYAEIIDVLDEYNAQEHIVDKYLKIYQVIENFMYKASICELCDKKSYSKLTLRDFKGISELLQKDERGALKSFILKVLKVSVDGRTFEERLRDSWINIFVSSGKIGVAERFVDKLRIENNKGGKREVNGAERDVDGKLIPVFCDMIYSTRCSIVHNKVNEYHITYMNLDTDIEYVMEHFLIPNMKEIAYGLMLNTNTVVQYRNNCLNLY